ncbi:MULTISPECIES: PucR family transcriptional regulator [Streptomyces]|uniref:Helix-turn-helix domain-containing protein n=1 Tax=Streptomyces griseoaurantiacus TaxID=68213 RepID=A0A7W2DS52_9ACTN|nr:MULTISPECIES: PucR family transcriptional regulator [Streptomyces]MBA5222016.1 helix-turn-helix domain-containing protein [Streptomyces griseoaurantiacus]
MITLTDLVTSLGAGLLRLVVAGPGAEIRDVVLAEPGEGAGQPGDLVLGVGVTHPHAAAELAERAAAAGAEGLVLKAAVIRTSGIGDIAERLGLALVELQPHVSWTGAVWLLRSVIDRGAGTDADAAGVRGTLFALADAAADIVEAPVTVEDAHSRVLAYSARQEITDSARVSTIVGRRVPAEVTAHFRARGVYRRLAGSSEPVLTPPGPDGLLPRLIIPVRAGGEWLGSIWAVAEKPVPPERMRELEGVGSALALHLLHLRADAGLGRRMLEGRLSAVLRHGEREAASALPPGPWRVIVLGAPDGVRDVGAHALVWESVARRAGWEQPLTVELDGLLYCLVSDVGNDSATTPRPGSVRWLRNILGESSPHDRSSYAVMGGLAHAPEEIPRSRGEAAELSRLVTAGRLPAAASSGLLRVEDVWDALVVERAQAATRIEAGLLGGPLAALSAHDREHGTAHLATLTAWLDFHGDPRGAAHALRIHPNTLRYRMRRLGEVAPVDLSSPRVRLALRLQLGAMEAAR